MRYRVLVLMGLFAACGKETAATTDMAPPDLIGADLVGVVFDLAVPSSGDLASADLQTPPDLRVRPDLIGADLVPPEAPTIAGCQILPSNHVFNTPIDDLPVHPMSAQLMATIENVDIHLDLGKELDQQNNEYYGIPYNIIHSTMFTWPRVAYTTVAAGFNWDPTEESDCAATASHTLISPCVDTSTTMPLLPIPSGVLVEGGTWPDNGGHAGDHHILLLDADTCNLWEVYHAFTGTDPPWHIFGSAFFDLSSNALRPKDWTSADAAGFPILPLLLRASEAESGQIHHALRFTIASGSIRTSYVWPARHLTNNGDDSTSKPEMGQLFRLKASYQIPPGYSKQSKAILQALKTYGMYLADGGSDLYIQGEPSADWDDAIFDEVQSVGRDQFEAVDITAITSRPGWNEDSGAVPPAP